jgi:hypothetical protein
MSGKWRMTDEAYLKMLSGKTMTRTLPGSSGTLLSAPTSAMAELGPAMIESSRFRRRHMREGVFVVHLDHVVIFVRAEEVGLLELDKAADAGDVVSFRGVHADDLDASVLFLEVSGRCR